MLLTCFRRRFKAHSHAGYDEMVRLLGYVWDCPHDGAANVTGFRCAACGRRRAEVDRPGRSWEGRSGPRAEGRGTMEDATPRRTLIVANRTAETPLLLQEVERRAAERPTTFALLIPDVTSRKAADWTLAGALKSLRRAAAGPHGTMRAHVDGLVGGADPLESIKQALAGGGFDDVIVSTLPKRRSQWLRRDLPRQVEALGLPVTVITQHQEDTRSLFEKVVQGTPPGMAG
jgi:hypothetical protein